MRKEYQKPEVEVISLRQQEAISNGNVDGSWSIGDKDVEE